MNRLQAVLCGALAVAAPHAASAAEAGDPVAATTRFAFFSDPEVNLHHFLHQWASAELSEGSPGGPAVAERDSLEPLTEGELQVWRQAIDFYRDNLARRSLLFDGEMVALRDALAGFPGVGPLPDLRDEPALAVAVIERAMPVYRDRWWVEHDAANRRWIARVMADLRAVEGDFATRLAVAYNGRWPDAVARVDVSVYGGRVGAYTSGAPHVVISSRDPGYRMPWAVEMLFHEMSHVGSLSGPLETAVHEAFRSEGVAAPASFSHVLIFETAGEIARGAWMRAGRRDYVPYAHHAGVYERNEVWAAYRDALQPWWRQYLEGRTSRAEALRRAVLALASGT